MPEILRDVFISDFLMLSQMFISTTIWLSKSWSLPTEGHKERGQGI